MPSTRFAVPLSAGESELLAQLDQETDARRTGDAAAELCRQLFARKAIPARRLRYFTDPDYHVGGHGKSRQDIFVRNGCEGDAIFRHAHFRQFLRYFLFGSDLPDAVITKFAAAVEGCGTVTSGDTEPLCVKARALTREYALEPAYAAEEFYRLVLDLGQDRWLAENVRKTVNAVRATASRR